MPYRIIISFVLLLIGSTTQAQDPAPALSYTRDIQPIFTEKCVACHACYDSACQLNLGSGEGAARGATKVLVYDGDRSQGDQADASVLRRVRQGCLAARRLHFRCSTPKAARLR